MPEHPSDPRDELAYGLLALGGICDLCADVSRAGKGFDCTGPAELGELLDMVRARLAAAVKQLDHWRPA